MCILVAVDLLLCDKFIAYLDTEFIDLSHTEQQAAFANVKKEYQQEVEKLKVGVSCRRHRCRSVS